MRLQGAVIREQGVKFAVVIVKKSVVDSSTRRVEAQRGFGPAFPGVPVVLMAQDSRGTPTYWGRHDIVRFLAGVPLDAIPWREYSIN